MTRLTMPGAMSAELAEKLSDVDDELTPAELDAIEKRVEEIIEERLAHGDISELFAGLDYKAWVPELQRELKIVVTASMRHIKKTLYLEAKRVWGDEAREQAEKELNDQA